MNLTSVEEIVTQVYKTSDLDWAHWIWSAHVPVVAHNAQKLCQRFGGKPEFAVAGAWLHDIGDTKVSRFADDHEETSDVISRDILTEAGYSKEDIAMIIKEVIAPHSCDEIMPTSLEGKILATADALAHLQTDFYLQVCWKHIPEGKTYEEFLTWVQAKLDRDYYKKIFFPEIQEEVKIRYEALKLIFRS